MSLIAQGIAYLIVLLVALLLISELRTVYDQRRPRERGGSIEPNSIWPPAVDTGHGQGDSCGGFGSGHGGGCDGGHGG